MNSTFSKAEELAEHIREYIDTRISMIKLAIAEKVSLVIANLVAGIVVAVVFFCVLLFASIAAAYALAAWLGQIWWGFLVLAGIYLLIGIIVWKGKQKIIRIPVMNAIIQQLFREEKDNEED